ncbi:aspartate--tRNA ligase [Candidatus Photodesmus anomalopis]|uniref:Aspartate--tRNA ligase n=1 Tax=Candidatus Photodesmus katoptron Akat1 TaxID=1236703 RepID=S3DZP6_9GAMM|nr:aspartate--tRNA ligase [Candidatus Photodesmus katoptron]EPE37421.1 aspartyl-tRNA synthetase [Candidatus Photodesmus katoptron Akat1]
MRTHYSGELDKSIVGQTIKLCGWVHSRRDLGGLIFIDMRDCSGVVQVVIEPYTAKIFSIANELRNEFCIAITGIVRVRPLIQINEDMPTGEIELLATMLKIINRSEPLPIDFKQDNSEEQRLRYRYLDLRRPEMYKRLKLRSEASRFMRNFLDAKGFLEIETPVLTKATPEGARDYLVPSRTRKGSFYALPQSPQLFKQLLMISGFDRYYQVVKCFRDEDLRADRQPEFTQIDIETSFMKVKDVQAITEKMICNMWKKLLGIDLGKFPVMKFSEVMRRFGSDKPDLRNPLELIDIADLVKCITFETFSIPANDINSRVTVLCLPGGAVLSRKKIDNYSKFVQMYGAKGLAWMKIGDLRIGIKNAIRSPVAKFLSDAIINSILDRTQAKSGDMIIFLADKKNIVTEALGALRIKLGKDLKLIDYSIWAPLWVIDFPMFSKDNEGNFYAMHHPFTSPLENLSVTELKTDPVSIVSSAYDMVLNGYEIGGGSARIHNRDIQSAVFELLGIKKHEQQEKFGFLLNALRFGTPPHAGIAFGLDRLVMLLCGTENIRDVIPFPKTTSAACLLTSAPSFIKSLVLEELNLSVSNKKKNI